MDAVVMAALARWWGQRPECWSESRKAMVRRPAAATMRWREGSSRERGGGTMGQQPWDALAKVGIGRGWRRKEEDRGILV